jgi:hypothetical protein
MGLSAFAAIAGLLLNPLGSVPDILQAGKPWYHFEDQDSVLQLIRARKVTVKTCKAWTEALTSVPGDDFVPVRPGQEASAYKSAWEPWGEKDLEAVKDCDDFPCKVKLDRTEVEAMKKAPEEGRMSKLFSLITDRLVQYRKSQVRRTYETPGPMIDPWKLFEERGFKSAEKRPETAALFARKLNFAPEKMLTMHQVIDRRAQSNAAGTEATVWLRDVYTDHYFDSWGEWESVLCIPPQGPSGSTVVIVIQSVLADMDLLKSHNIFAHALFGKYRGAFEDNGKPYLDAQFNQLKKTAQKLEADASSQKQPTKAPH